MATNTGGHNAPGLKMGPVTDAPPPPSKETKLAVREAAKDEPTGQSAPSTSGDAAPAEGEKKVKTEKELEKERKKAEKLAKFQQKQQAKAAAASAPSAAPSKKAEKKKAAGEELTEYKEETPKGEKKILKPLDEGWLKAYQPRAVESAWYDWWEKEGFFKPEFGADGNVKSKGYFVIPVPPPNVTGALHCGHALATALQDLLIRWNRMKGKTVLYLPGCDHAGISTQSVVENMLWRRQGKTRHDLGRTKFIETVWDWKDEYHTKINSVLRRIGGSFDWTREAFTMDKNLSAAVTETFVRLHEEGYIYRANRLVNWCTRLNTALSNLEVDNKELTGRTKLSVPGYDKLIEFGCLTYFKYEVEGGSTIEVATTRPETMLGDTAIAVHPNDERYKNLVGKTASHPFIEGRKLLIVADDYVDPEFGTGAVKITPAHDPNDYEIGKRHKLEFINILNDDGTMNENAGPYKGMKRFDVRYKVVEDLTARGLLVKQEDNPMKVPLCSKSKDVIEPLLKPQWWMKMKDLAEPAIKVVEDGSIKIRPGSAHRNYLHWLKNINDWCLSRQLWWGHQIPAYYVKIEGKSGSTGDDSLWVTGRTEEEALKKAQDKFPGEKITLERDPDVLDTWFSSGLWPFSTLGWPNKTLDMDKLFPTSLLETGWDILFFWVARMIMFSLKLTGKIPFSEVYCHSLIRDSEGRKMSKSLGNVIDPVDIMDGIALQTLHDKLKVGNLDPKEVKMAEKYQKTAFPQGIPECGADALRFTLIQYTTGGGDIAFDIKVMHAYRRFANKVWQSTKYVLGVLGTNFKPGKKNTLTGGESAGDLWILHRLSETAKAVNNALAAREFADSTKSIYAFYYDQLCDTFIEFSKAELRDHPEREVAIKNALYNALEGGLLLLSPYMPFITEELWQRLPRREGDKTPSICIAEYPEEVPEFTNPEAEKTFELAIKVSSCIKSVVATSNLKNPKLYVKANNGISLDKLDLADVYKLCQYLKLSNSAIELLKEGETAPEGCATSPEDVKDITVYGKDS